MIRLECPRCLADISNEDVDVIPILNGMELSLHCAACGRDLMYIVNHDEWEVI